MQDLKIAKLRLKEGNLTLVIVRGGRVILETKSQGVSGFLLAIEKFDRGLASSSVADKIVGAAAAMLCAYCKVVSVFAVTISEEGMKVLENNNIPYEFEKRVPNILNHDRTDICPFEKLAAGSRNPKEAYDKLKSFSESGGKGHGKNP